MLCTPLYANADSSTVVTSLIPVTDVMAVQCPKALDGMAVTPADTSKAPLAVHGQLLGWEV